MMERKNPLFDKRYRHQVLAAFIMQILTLSHGIGIGWLAPALKLLQSPESPLNFDISVDQASWIGSFYGLGVIAGSVVFGLLINRIGRHICLYLVALPHMFIWVLIYFAQDVEFLYASRFVGGVTSGGLYVVMPIFLSEILDPSIRGTLNSIMMFVVSLGIFLGFLLSAHVNYFVLPCIIITLPIMYIIGISFFPETPQYLLQSNNFKKAEESFKYYKQIPKDKQSTPEAPKQCVEFEELKHNILGKTHSTPVSIKDFLTKDALKASLTAFVIIILNQFSGSFSMTSYMTLIFIESGSTIDPNTSTISTGVALIIGALIAVVLIDRWGRRILLLTSAIGEGIGLFAFGFFVQFTTLETKHNFNWVPAALMTYVYFISNVGVNILLFAIIVEVSPAKIRSNLSSIAMIVFSITMFIALKIYPYFIYSLGIDVTMYSCAAVCFVTAIYLYIFLPETKGKSMDHD